MSERQNLQGLTEMPPETKKPPAVEKAAAPDENDPTAVFAGAVCRAMAGFSPSPAGSRVTVALSGGADSLALCHFLVTHAGQLGITVAAAHLNHGLRGAESDADEAFVRVFCARWGVPLTCHRLPPAAPSGEEALRKARYAFLWQAAGEGFLATAHTLTDSCETLLFCLARGARLGGARGIPAQRGRLLRPLLALTREQIEEYCRAEGLDYVTDSSNHSDRYARNRLRHHALPALRSVNPHAEQALGAFMREAAAVYDYLALSADQLLRAAALPGPGETVFAKEPAPPAGEGAVCVRPEPADPSNLTPAPPAGEGPSPSAPPFKKNSAAYSAAVLAAAPAVVLRQALLQLLAPYGETSAARLALAEEVVRRGGALEWRAGVRLRCAGGRVFLAFAAPPPPPPPAFCVPAAPGRYRCAAGLWVEIRQLACAQSTDFVHSLPPQGENASKSRKIHKKDLNNCLDCARIATAQLSAGGEPPLLRLRAPGDRFAPAGGAGSKSLKKWLNEIACPPPRRGRLPLIAVGSRVLWLAGSGAAAGVGADETSRTLWQIAWQDETPPDV